MSWLSDFFLRLIVLAPPILMALTVHEAAHALLARLRGDATAVRAGRLSLNPIRHLDPMGTIVFFVTAWMGAGVGWAKPVPVDARNLSDPRRDMIFISAAGPVVNLLFAVIIALLLRGLVNWGVFSEPGLWRELLGNILLVGVQVNVILAFFNLIPVPPLDGSGILGGLLSPRAALKYQEFGRYGFIILLALIFLPGWLPGFPDLISLFVLRPASYLVGWLLPI